RAVRGALALLKEAEAVTIVSIRDSDRDAEVHPEEVAAHLARHGVPAASAVVECGRRSRSEALLDEAEDRGCDLIVLGAYSRSTMREILLGGVSRTMFTQDRLPILASH
ncbi:MAG: universal stress protein, partial [Pseudomonadota bacterium]